MQANNHRKHSSTPARLASIGCCLLLACAGCVYPELQQQEPLYQEPLYQEPLSDDPLVNLHQFLFEEFPEDAPQIEFSEDIPDNPPQPGHAWAEESLQLGSDPDWLAATTADLPAPPEPGLIKFSVPEDCDATPAVDHDLSCAIHGDCSLPRPLQARREARLYHHPRFHPVPLRPVFSPRYATAPTTDPGAIPVDGRVPSPGDKTPQIEILLPVPAPEEFQPPEPETEDRDRVTRTPERLETASRARSWIFNAPVLRRPPFGGGKLDLR